MTYDAYDQAQKKKSPVLAIVGGVLLLLSVIAAVVAGVAIAGSAGAVLEVQTNEFAVGEVKTVTADGPRSFTLYRKLDTGDGSDAGFVIADDAGLPATFEPIAGGATLDVQGDSYVMLGSFAADAAGGYSIEATGGGPDAIYSLGPGLGELATVGIAGGSFCCIIPVGLVGLVLLIIGLVMYMKK